MTKLIWLSLIIAALNINLVLSQEEENCCEEYCYALDADKSQTRQYATKTAYEIAKGQDSNVNLKIDGCVQQKVWIMIRHGTRYPTKETIENMKSLSDLKTEILKNYDERRTQPSVGGLCQQDKFQYKFWKLPVNLTVDGIAEKLAPQGYTDLKLMAKNYRRFLNEIFANTDERDFDFRYTPTQRTQESYKAFAEAILTESHVPSINPTADVDPVLNAYKGCSLWNEQDKNIKAQNDSEYNKFNQSPIMKNAIHSISRRLGFKFDLAIKQIRAIWDMCRYEQAWHPERSSCWCSVFTPEHVNILEYAEDLKNYYKVGYGNELNSRVACSSIKDMIHHLNNTDGPHIAAYFTHSANIQLLLNALGAAKDRNALTADNYHLNKNRKWRASILAPFASNVAAVKYSCNGGSEDKVMFILNQRPLDFDWCKVGLCNWKDTLVNYQNFINADCSSYYCSQNSSTKIYQSSILVLFLIMYLFY